MAEPRFPWESDKQTGPYGPSWASPYAGPPAGGGKTGGLGSATPSLPSSAGPGAFFNKVDRAVEKATPSWGTSPLPGTTPQPADPDKWNYQGQTEVEDVWPEVRERLSGPSALQEWQTENAGRFLKPLAGEQMAMDRLRRIQNMGPGVSSNLDPYYNRARDRARQDIDASMAARGAFGSTAATGTISDAMAGLSAQQAAEEADFSLRAAAEQRGWEELKQRGGLGLGDLEARRLGMGVETAMGASSDELQRTLGLQRGAEGTWGARRERGQDLLDELFKSGAFAAGMAGNVYADILGTDQVTTETILQYGTGIAADTAAEAQRAREQGKAGRADALDTIAAVQDIASGGGKD